VLAVTCGLWWEAAGSVLVTIKDFKFVTEQRVLRLVLPSVIKVRNDDAERLGFGSTMFEGIPAQVEKDGVIVYGRGVGVAKYWFKNGGVIEGVFRRYNREGHPLFQVLARGRATD
jgi:hypothetical protein